MKKPRYSVMKGVKVGKKTRIYDQVNLFKCKIGKNCKIDSYVYIEAGVEIGNNVKIRAFTFIPEGVRIEDNAFIGPRVTFTNDKYPRARGEWRLLRTVVKEGASIGAGCVIGPGVSIGSFSLIGAGSVVTKDLEDHAIAVGCPAAVIGHTTDRKFKLKVRSFLREQPGDIKGEPWDWPWL
jgi:UDP-2-acetamido-3-amino-2,3-dideoxy-glucuronate N-acetyltransferase